MSIANELSSDVAAAVLMRKNGETSADSSELKNMVLKVHSTLRHLTAEARKGNRRPLASSDPLAKNAASNHQ